MATAGQVSELRVVLLGGFLSHRNLVWNFILGLDGWKNRPITVINTPDLLSPTEKKKTKFIRDIVRLSAPGPHVFLLVLQLEDFTEGDKNWICRVLETFSDRSFDHSLPLILMHGQKKDNLALNQLIEKCRYEKLEIEDIFEHRKTDVLKLMTCFDKIMEDNNGEHVECTKFEDAGTFPSAGDSQILNKLKASLVAPITDSDVDNRSLNLVLFGPSGSLKTAAAKVILGHQDLPSESVRKQGEVFGRWVSLVELPALDGKAQQEVMEESFRCVSLCDPEGVHAFILVLPVGPLTDEDKGELHTIQDTFSSRVNDFTIILFTTKSHHADKDVGNLIKENKDIQDLLQICGGRHFVLNIRDRRQIPDLMETVETNVSDRKNLSSYKTQTLAWGQREDKLKLQTELQQLKGTTPHTDGCLKPSTEERCDDQNTSELLGTERKNISEGCLRMVLIGKTGSGKSSSGNTILGKDEFKSAASPQSVTSSCQKAESLVDGRQVVVVDTPGLFDTKSSSDQVNEELKKCISLVSPGPHVFLLVLQIGRFTIEDTETLRRIEEALGENSKKFTIVLFTNGDKLEHAETNIQDYIKNYCNETCKKLIRDCGGRYHVFNNYNKENHSQVKKLIKMINNMVKENGGSCYTERL